VVFSAYSGAHIFLYGGIRNAKHYAAAKEIYMKKIRGYREGMLAMMLMFTIIFAGCDDGSTGGGTSEEAQVQNLPSFEGESVASEEEAQEMQAGADVAINTAITTALAQGAAQANMLPSRAAGGDVYGSGHYEYNGVTLDYTVSGSTTSLTYPYYYSIKYVATIDGTYSGYRIKGKYNMEVKFNITSASAYDLKYTYNCVYAVSKDGKGMKLVYNGKMDYVYPFVSGDGYIFNVHYSVYDNKNVRIYNFDYKHPS
jgi:hypothetical protein